MQQSAPVLRQAAVDIAVMGTGIVSVDSDLKMTRVAPELVREDEKPTLKLGDINNRLEVVSVSADQLAKLGFTATVDRGARLYRESEYPLICAAIRRHMSTAAIGVAA